MDCCSRRWRGANVRLCYIVLICLLLVPTSLAHAGRALRQASGAIYINDPDPDPYVINTTLELEIVVSDSGEITDLDVYLDFLHDMPDDLTIQLSHNDLTVMIYRRSCSELSFQVTIDDEALDSHEQCPTPASIRSPGNLNQFYGMDVNGTWTLRFKDGPQQGAGQIREWRLIVNGGETTNAAPAATDDAYTTAEDTPLTVPAATGVLANDSDPDGDPLAASLTTGPAHGTLTLSADGSFTYTPNANYHGADSFTYTASDGNGGTDTATVTLTITSVNDPPVATDDAYTTVEDTPLTFPAPGVLTNDTDADRDPLTAGLISGPAHGTLTLNADGSFTYTPAANYHGADSFTYIASDGNGGTDTATVTITVTSVNDPPVATDDAYTTVEDTPLTVPAATGVLANDSDPDGDPLAASLTTGPDHGTLTLNADGSFTYTPNANYHGADSFTYTVSDGNIGTDTATVTLTITSVNDPPIATDDAYFTFQDIPLTVPVPGVLTNDTDADRDPLTAGLISGPAHGTLYLYADGSFTYTPDANYHGADSFTYIAMDGLGGTDTATVTITVTRANNTPPAAADDTYTTVQDTPLSVPAPGVLGNDTDPDGDSLSATLYPMLPDITLTLSPDGALSYTPEPGWRGILVFSYVVSDGHGGTDIATVTITVTPANLSPVADDDAYFTSQDTPLTVAAPGVLANDSDPDADTLAATVDTPPAYGTLTLDSDGALAYTPGAGFHGTDTFTYIASDGRGGTDTATVTIFVFESSSPPHVPDPSVTPPPTPTPVPGPSGSAAGPAAGPQSAPPAVPTVTTATPPPPTIPLCADPAGSTSAVVRADVPHGAVAGGVFCRVIVQHGAYLSHQGGPGDIGHPDVLRHPILHAVDVFGMVGDTSVPYFTAPVKVCLQGVGTLFYLDATTAPRALSTPPVTLEHGYTCATIPHAGTVVLTGTAP